MGGQSARYLEQRETINMKDFIQKGIKLQWKDNQSINKLQRQLKIMKFRGTEEQTRQYKIMFEEELKENIVISIKKRINQMVQPNIHDKESKREMEKDTGCESVEQIDSIHPLQDAQFELVQTESQPYLAFEFQNNQYTYRAIPFGTKHSPIYFATAMGPIMQQIRIKTEIGIINFVDDILLLHHNKEYLKNMTQLVIDKLKYFGFTINTQKSETEPNQTVIFLGWELILANVTVKTKPKKRLLLLYDLYNMRRWIKTGTELTVKQAAKLIGKLNYLRLQFQEASLFLNIMDHQKAQAARLRGWNTTMTMNKIAILDINWWIAKLRANIPAQLIQIPPQITMTTDAAPSGWGSTLERELEMIAMAHGTWNKRQAKLSSNSREIKAITQGLQSFAKTLKNSRVQSLAIRSNNSTAVFDFRKWRASIILMKKIKKVHQTIEKLGIQIQITHVPGVKTEIRRYMERANTI
ncbi:MAG: putative Transposon Ty3-I Gag-Pol polyprotein [Streblomastix strix]|uniref:Putative Transposon Ty3-I Gag-Pol polyprotein n=1 Tax=Streblomastix strix TaxID=222440 RepID=A0A5J4V2Z8_9EUKA|nr:MAG: putative Transposon Ty3-I Gag-Pol polyprotein [Streblomastix strix]